MIRRQSILQGLKVVAPVAVATLVISIAFVHPTVESNAVATSDIADGAITTAKLADGSVSLSKMGIGPRTYVETVNLGTISAQPNTRTSYPVLVLPANPNVTKGKIKSVTYTASNLPASSDSTSEFYIQQPNSDLALCNTIVNSDHSFINVTQGLNPIYSHWCNISGETGGTSFNPSTFTTPIVYRLVYRQGSVGGELKNFSVTIEYTLNN